MARRTAYGRLEADPRIRPELRREELILALTGAPAEERDRQQISRKALAARLGKLVRDGVIVLSITLVIAEIGARIATKSGDNGMPAVGRFALLPYRPEAAVVEAWQTSLGRATYVIEDAELGWTIARNGKGQIYEANAEAVRARPDRVFGETPPEGKIRIVTFGDSFTHGDEVKEDETWQHHLEAIDSGLEVLNLGVPGYGTDQAFLRWRRDGGKFGAQVAILGIWPEDVCRNLNVVRYYLAPTSSFLGKPRFVMEGAALKVVNSPVVRGPALARLLSRPEAAPVLQHEYWLTAGETTPKLHQSLRIARIFESALDVRRRRAVRDDLYSGADPRGIEITTAVAGQFAKEARERGQLPLVLLIPMSNLLLTHHVEENQFPLVKALRAAGLEVIDMGPPMMKVARERGIQQLFVAGGHMTPSGNRALAEAVAKALAPYVQRVRIGTVATGTSGAGAWPSAPSSRRNRATIRSAAWPSP